MLEIIIIDDSEMMRSRLSRMFTEIRGVTVVGEAETAADGIALIRRTKPHVVILDIRMAGGSGFGVLEAMKQQLPILKFIVCTNYPYSQVRAKALKLGAQYFFNKNSDMQKVVETVTRLSNELTAAPHGMADPQAKGLESGTS